MKALAAFYFRYANTSHVEEVRLVYANGFLDITDTETVWRKLYKHHTNPGYAGQLIEYLRCVPNWVEIPL